MKKYFSCYLDLVRFIAALAVVLVHYGDHIIGAAAGRFVPELAREAVTLFFVLSGFVIAFVTETKERTARQYAIARVARIYSVALPLLLLAFCLLYISEEMTGRAAGSDYQVKKAYLYLPLHMLFMGESWTLSEPPTWVGSYWSLAYEVWYYVFFGILLFCRGKKRVLLALLVFLITGYKFWLLFPVWYSGVLLWRLRGRVPLGKNAARAGWLFSIACLCLYKLFGWDAALRLLSNQLWPFAGLPLGSAERYLCDYAVAMMVCINFYCAAYTQFIALEKFERVIRLVSSFTFTLYLGHILVLEMWLYYHPGFVGSLSQGLILAVLTAAFTIPVGLLLERRRPWFARQLTRFYDFVSLRLFHAALPETQYQADSGHLK